MSLSISRRSAGIAPSATLTIDAKAKAMAAQGEDVVGFGAGEPDFPTPSYICEAAHKAIDQGMTKYTPSSGTLDLRRAICAKLLRDQGLTYAPGQVVVSSGAKHTLSQLVLTLVDPGDEVLIPSPCWVSYPEMVRMAEGVPVCVQGCEEDGFTVSAGQLRQHITPRTKALILNSPNNPNGCVWNREQLLEIARLAVEHDFYVISDEIYEKLVYDGEEHVSIASLGQDIYQRTIVVGGVSKAYSMTGWRIGFAAGPQNVMDALGNFQSHAASNANAIAQHAAAAAFSGGEAQIAQMVAAFDERRVHICERVNAIPGLSCVRPKGAFYVMINIKGLIGKRHQGAVIADSLTFTELLLTCAKVAVVPGSAFEAEGFVRVSYATSMEKIDKGLDRIAQFVAELV